MRLFISVAVCALLVSMSVSAQAEPVNDLLEWAAYEAWEVVEQTPVDPPISKPEFPVRLPGTKDLPFTDGLPVVPSPSPGPAAVTYPGLAVGVTIASASEIDAAEELADGAGLTLRLRLRSTDPVTRRAEVIGALQEANLRGHDTVLGLGYGGHPDGPVGFATWVAGVVAETEPFAPAFEITNRPNGVISDARGDQPYFDSVDAMFAGVMSANATDPGAEIGFSWLSTGIEAVDALFWVRLRDNAPAGFADAVDFVSTHLYPGTLGLSEPWLATNGPRSVVHAQLVRTRTTWMPMLGLGDAALVVGEMGFPVAYDRVPAYSEFPDAEQAMKNPNAQVLMLAEMAEGVRSAKRTADISLMTWADLTDAAGCLDNRCWGLIDLRGDSRPAYDHWRFEIDRSQNALPPTPTPTPTPPVVEPPPGSNVDIWDLLF